MPRPTYSTTNTATTLLSTTSCATDSGSTAYNSTALTTPDLHSPYTKQGQASRLEPMLDIFEGRQQRNGDQEDYLSRNRSRSPAPGVKMEERYADSPRTLTLAAPIADISRGPSVRDRAKEFEGIAKSPNPTPAPRPLPSPHQIGGQGGFGSSSATTPLRINKGTSAITSAGPTPRTSRRIPAPATPTTEYSGPGLRSPTPRSPSSATRRGSTRKMIQQWETGPSTPLEQPNKMTSPIARRVISRDYLDHKPLPVPKDTPATSTPLRNTTSNTSTSTYHQSPSRSTYAPSPLNQYHLQTPDAGPSRKRGDLSPSGSAYSLSPSGEKRRKGKSPLKDILNVFGGGIQAIGRRARDKGKGLSSYGSKDSLASKHSTPWSDPMDRIGSNGLPGGIVFSDRMGDKEMMRRTSDPAIIRGSAIMYLTATPCSSVSPWGSWLTSWAILTPHDLKVTYCPIFQDPKSGHTTPKRILSGTGFFQGTSTPAVPFSSIPPPELGSQPDVELDMTQCVEVRSLRKEEVRGRGIPSVPEGVGTEVLEMVWRDGSKRYIGVEGVGGRLGWVSAIWDVLLAYKPEETRELPPPSPVLEQDHTFEKRHPSRAQTASLASFPFPESGQQTHSSLSDFEHRIRSMEAKTGSSAPPVQKVGDTWVAAADLDLGRGSMSDIGLGLPPAAAARGEGDDLRNSVQRMFDTGPDVPLPLSLTVAPGPDGTPSRSDSEATARIKAWQPATERELSIFSRSGTGRSHATASPMSVHRNLEAESEVQTYGKADTQLSFDPNDLNPSRSASQVRRTSTLLGGNLASRARGGALTVVEERSDDGMTEAMRAATQISHVTFPKPTVSLGHGHGNNDGTSNRTLTPIPSVSHSSTESEETATMRTPHTARSTITYLSSLDQTVLGHMEKHTSEHGKLSSQVDGVQHDLRAAIVSLSALLAQSKVLSDPTRAPVPKALDDRLMSLGLDIKGVENAIQLSSLAATRQPSDDAKLPEIHNKLDSIAKACEDILAKHNQHPGAGYAFIAERGDVASQNGLPPAKRPPMPEKRGSLGLTTDPEAEKQAGEEVAQIMAQLTGGSIQAKASPRLGGLQVLHSSAPSPTSTTAGGQEGVTQQITEVLGLVKELKDARVIQTQQTTDMARYLNELNAWLEKFVANSSKEITDMSSRLKTLVGEPGTEERASVPGLPDLVADVHSMMSEQKRRNDEEGMMGQRVDNLLKMMGDERERMAGQQSTVEHVLSVIENHRQANENVLRSLAIDLTNEIRGERLRFVEAMQQATTVNVNFHVEEFKKVLATEVNKAMGELGHVRAEKQALEQQISDLFALKAKHAPGSSRKNTRKGAVPPMSPQMGQMPGQMQMQSSPGMQGRTLPAPPR